MTWNARLKLTMAFPLTAVVLVGCVATDYVQMGTARNGEMPIKTWPPTPASGAVAQLTPEGAWPAWYGIDQGWSYDQRRAFWFTPQGSWMIPYGWILALEQAGNTAPFLAPANIERLSYIPASKDEWNPGGLPLGFAVSPGVPDKDGKPGMSWVGPTCAACHSNKITYRGKELIIDGAPSLGDFYHLNVDMLDALIATTEQPDKFDRFVTALITKKFLPDGSPATRADLKNQMYEHQIWLADYLSDNLCGTLNGKHCLEGDHSSTSAQDGSGGTYSTYLSHNEAAKTAAIQGVVQGQQKPIAISDVLGKGYLPLPGNGRIDAIGAIFNQVSGPNIAVPKANHSPSTAPVSYPFLWGTPQSDRLQWNGFAANSSILGIGFGPLGRNVGEVLGVYGRIAVTVSDPGRWTSSDGSFEQPNLGKPAFGFASTTLTNNLGHIEDWVSTLRAPRWPEGILPAIDQGLAHEGEQIYLGKSVDGVNCAACHQRVWPEDEGKPYQAVMIQTSVIGTDPGMADNYLLALNKETARPWESGKLEGKSPNLIQFWSPSYGPTLPSRAEALTTQVAGVLLSDIGTTISAGRLSETFKGKVADVADPRSYKARPLTGIWATAPYLHNGSVPSLAQLLTPAEAREPKFRVGSQEFDPVAVGFTNDTKPEHFLFDTRVPGNLNSGHTGKTYGTTLSDHDKRALLEFLKTL